MNWKRLFKKLNFPGKNPDEKNWWKQELQAQNNEWLPCQIKALSALKTWTQQLKETGFLMVSDKGLIHSEIAYSEPPQPYGHGLHSSWPVNFPLLRKSLQTAGLSVQHTTNPLWTFHSLLAYKVPPNITQAQQSSEKNMFKEFNLSFEKHNINQYAADLIDSAEDYVLQEQWRKAAILYKQALEYRPRDARVSHQLVACLMELHAFNQAEDLLQEEFEDIFSQYDFAFQRGQVKLFQGHYIQASNAFKESLKNFGPDANAFYNLGLTQIFMDQYAQARSNFKTALKHDPGFDMARTALNTWQE